MIFTNITNIGDPQILLQSAKMLLQRFCTKQEKITPSAPNSL